MALYFLRQSRSQAYKAFFLFTSTLRQNPPLTLLQVKVTIELMETVKSYESYDQPNQINGGKFIEPD